MDKWCWKPSCISASADSTGTSTSGAILSTAAAPGRGSSSCRWTRRMVLRFPIFLLVVYHDIFHQLEWSYFYFSFLQSCSSQSLPAAWSHRTWSLSRAGGSRGPVVQTRGRTPRTGLPRRPCWTGCTRWPRRKSCLTSWRRRSCR